MSKIIVVTTTCDDPKVLESIARHLIERRLAACCQIHGPITSIYRWQGDISESTEWVCSIKTTHSRYEQVELAIKDLHSYDQPEIIALNVATGSQGYLDWVQNESWL